MLRGAYPDLSSEHREHLIGRFRVPEPRVALGPRLAGLAHAMIDISDGLLADLGHICETSEVGAAVVLAALPLSPAASAVIAIDPSVRPKLAGGGDDYELLFTAPGAAKADIQALSAELGVPITMIGRIEPGASVRLVDAAGRTIPVEAAGYRHF